MIKQEYTHATSGSADPEGNNKKPIIMGMFKKKKTAQSETENVVASLEQAKKKSSSVKIGAGFMQEKYDSIYRVSQQLANHFFSP